VVSGTAVSLKVSLTNRSTGPFPGGTLTLEIDHYGTGGVAVARTSLTAEGGQSFKLPVIGIQEKYRHEESAVHFPLVGASWLRASVEAQDRFPVLLTKSATGPASPQAAQFFTVLSRIDLEILLALRERRGL
jgi:hypothetical protein